MAGAVIAEACEQAGIAESTYYEWKQSKPEFSESIARAREQYALSIDEDLAAQFTARLLDLTVNGHTVTRTTEKQAQDEDGKMVTIAREVETIHYSAPPKWVADKLMPDSLADRAIPLQATQVNVLVEKT